MTSTQDQIARGTRALLALAAAASLGFEGDFNGCGGPRAPSGPIPDGPRAECLVDADCTAMMCTVARCVVNRCVMVESVVDADLDGQGAMPCGNDCDDRSPIRATGMAERCDLVDNDCDDRVDEGASATFLVGSISSSSSSILAAAPVTAGATPGILFVSNFGGGSGSIEARWLDPNSAVLALASIADSSVGLADARDLGGGRAEIVWSTSSGTITVRRAVVRVTTVPTASILVESAETIAALPAPARALQLEGDARGSAILVDADGTQLILPGQAPIALAAPSAFDLAVIDSWVVIPGGSGVLNFYNRDTGAVGGSVTLPSELGAHDGVIAWGSRLFAFAPPELVEIDPVTLRFVGRPLPLDTFGPVTFGSLTNQLVYIDATFAPRGFDASLRPTEHAAFGTQPGDNAQLFELGTRLTVVSLDPVNTTYQVEQCGN